MQPSRRPATLAADRQWLERNRLSLPGLAEPASKIARTQRRGRPGIAPEFPVCRRKAAAFPGHQARVGECTGDAGHVKPRRPGPYNRQSPPRLSHAMENPAGHEAAAHQTLPVVTGRAAPSPDTEPTACFAHASSRGARQKSHGRCSSRFHQVADSPLVPRGITVPVGQPGGGSNLRSIESRNDSTGLPWNSSWITTSG